LEANAWYAHIQHSNGREDTVSISDLAPCSNEGIEFENFQVIPAVEDELPTNIPEEVPSADVDQHKPMNDVEPDLSSTSNEMSSTPILRRSGRKRRSPDRYGEPIVYSWLLPIVRRVLFINNAESV